MLNFANIRLAAALIIAMFAAMAIPSAQAQTFSVLYNFDGASHGGDPYASLIRDAAGNLYSTVDYGGGTSFAGGVFKVFTRRARQRGQFVRHNFAGRL